MKTALIWGANGGIGRAVLAKLQAAKWQVAAVTHHPVDLANPAGPIVDADVTSPYDVQLAVSTIGQELAEVDLFLYTAGDILSQPIAELEPPAWERILGANLSGAYLTTHYSRPLLAPTAHLVYVGAMHERLRLPGLGAYAAAKAGLEAFVEALRKEERQRRVTVVRPAAVDTPFWEKVPLRLPRDAMSPEQVATAILEAYDSGHKGILDLK